MCSLNNEWLNPECEERVCKISPLPESSAGVLYQWMEISRAFMTRSVCVISFLWQFGIFSIIT